MSRRNRFAAVLASSLVLWGCPAPPPPTPEVAISVRPQGGYEFSIRGKDGNPRPYPVLLAPGVRFTGIGGSLADPEGNARLGIESQAYGARSLDVLFHGPRLYLGGLAMPPTEQTVSGVPDYGFVVLGSGAAIPFDPNAETEPLWIQTWEGKDDKGQRLRVEIVGSISFPKEALRVIWAHGDDIQDLTLPREGNEERLKGWPGRSPAGFGSLEFDFEAGLAKGEWKLGSDDPPGPTVELKLTHNGPWAPSASPSPTPTPAAGG